MLSKNELVLYLVLLTLIFSFVWQLFVFQAISMEYREDLNDSSLEGTAKKLGSAFRELKESRKLFEDLKNLLLQHLNQNSVGNHYKKLKTKYETLKNQLRVPTFQHEYLLKRLARNINDYINFIKYERGVIQYDFRNISFEFPPDFMSSLEEYRGPILSDLEQLKQTDGYEEWRKSEFKRLSDIVQMRLHRSQNPGDCENARKLFCVHYNCGFTCEADHILNCLTLAHGLRRTLLLKRTKPPNYDADFAEIFYPLSDDCAAYKYNESEVVDYPASNDNKVLHLWASYTGPGLEVRPPYFPIALPKDLAAPIEKIHGNPGVWWTGQLLKYTLRTRSQTQNYLDRRMTELGFQSPIVGVHVRRTDKKEDGAEFHPLEKYMAHVEAYYNNKEVLDEPFDKRRVFLATDDPSVIIEAREKYPHIEFITDDEGSKLAEHQETRYSKASLFGVILVVHLLSLTDHLVCTLSSEVCRTAYGLMQANRDYDASLQVNSLDYIYLYIEQSKHYSVAVLPHKARVEDEFSFEKGEIIEEAKEMLDTIGLIVATHNRTKESGLVPRFKLRRLVETADFPTYGVHP